MLGIVCFVVISCWYKDVAIEIYFNSKLKTKIVNYIYLLHLNIGVETFFCINNGLFLSVWAQPTIRKEREKSVVNCLEASRMLEYLT